MRTLLIQTGFLGDVVLSTPAIAAVKSIFPSTSLSIMTTPAAAPLVKYDPFVHEVIEFDKRRVSTLQMAREIRRRKFDRVLSLHRSYRTAFIVAASGARTRIGFSEARFPFVYTQRSSRFARGHEVMRNLALFEPLTSVERLPRELRLFLAPELSSRIQAITSGPPYVVLSPGSVWHTKEWHWEHYRTLGMRLLERSVRVILVGAPAEAGLAERIARGTSMENVAGVTSIPEMLAIVANAQGVVCNDSFTLHAASAFKRPTVAVFCATVPSFGFGPWENPAAVTVGLDALACRPCARHGGKSCPLGTEYCMRRVEPGLVFDELMKVMGKVAA